MRKLSNTYTAYLRQHFCYNNFSVEQHGYLEPLSNCLAYALYFYSLINISIKSLFYLDCFTFWIIFHLEAYMASHYYFHFYSCNLELRKKGLNNYWWHPPVLTSNAAIMLFELRHHFLILGSILKLSQQCVIYAW